MLVVGSSSICKNDVAESHTCSARTISIHCDSKASAFTIVSCGIPRGLIIGPILFIMYSCTNRIWWGLSQLHVLLYRISSLTIRESRPIWSLFTQWSVWSCSPCLGGHRWNSELDAIKQTPTQRTTWLYDMATCCTTCSCSRTGP